MNMNIMNCAVSFPLHGSNEWIDINFINGQSVDSMDLQGLKKDLNMPVTRKKCKSLKNMFADDVTELIIIASHLSSITSEPVWYSTNFELLYSITFYELHNMTDSPKQLHPHSKGLGLWHHQVEGFDWCPLLVHLL